MLEQGGILQLNCNIYQLGKVRIGRVNCPCPEQGRNLNSQLFKCKICFNSTHRTSRSQSNHSQETLWMVWSWSSGSVNKIGANITLESWLFRFRPHSPDCKVWHSRRDLVGAGSFWLVRIWCGLWHTGAVRCRSGVVRCGLMLCGADCSVVQKCKWCGSSIVVWFYDVFFLRTFFHL